MCLVSCVKDSNVVRWRLVKGMCFQGMNQPNAVGIHQGEWHSHLGFDLRPDVVVEVIDFHR